MLDNLRVRNDTLDLKRSSSGQKQMMTLDRPNLNHGKMPDPDDILPREAWTDFSGQENWSETLKMKDKKRRKSKEFVFDESNPLLVQERDEDEENLLNFNEVKPKVVSHCQKGRKRTSRNSENESNHTTTTTSSNSSSNHSALR